MRNKIRLYIFLLTMIFLLILVPFNTSASQSAINIDMKVNAGFNNITKAYGEVPFHITLINKGAEVSGEVQIIGLDYSGQKTIYATPFNLPEKSEKEVVINGVQVSPFYKKIEVRLAKGKKIIKTSYYEFSKRIENQIPIVGVLCDNPDAFRKLNGVKIIRDTSIFSTIGLDMKLPISAEQSAKINKAVEMYGTPAEVIPFDSETIPDDIMNLLGIDVLIISDFDTSSLSNKQVEAIKSWVGGNRLLIIGTGANWGKVYRGLNNELKPFKISGTKDIPFPGTALSLSDKISNAQNLSIAAGSIGNGAVAIEEGGNPLGIIYKINNGIMSELTFDPSLSNVTNQTDVQFFWKNFICLSQYNAMQARQQAEQRAREQEQIPSNYINLYLGSNDLFRLVTNIPENQAPPFLLLLVLIVIYVIIIGPVIYLVLKWKDRRDFSWTLIPAITLVFLMIIYFAGYKTRYSTAVLNKVSAINLYQGMNSAYIQTGIGAYNNESGSMKLKYDEDTELEVISNDRFDISRLTADEINNLKISKKITYSNPRALELYDVNLWQPKYMYTYKSKPTKGGFTIDSVNIHDGKLFGIAKNKTDFNMSGAFIILGGNIYNIGDVAAGQDKNIVINLTGKDHSNSLSDYLDSLYGKPYDTYTRQTVPPTAKQNMRNIIETVVRNAAQNERDDPKIMSVKFFALNYEDPYNDVTVNNKAPKTFNTNIICSKISLEFEKNKSVTIPAGVIKSVLGESDSAYLDDKVMNSVKVFADGDFSFKYTLLKNIKINNIRIDIPAGQQSKAGEEYDKYTYYIFNYSNSKWEEIQKGFSVGSNNLNNYIKNMELQIKVNADLVNDGEQEELFKAPGLEISGVIK